MSPTAPDWGGVSPARHPDGPDPARVEHVRLWLDPNHGWPEGLGWPVEVSAGTEGFDSLARLWIGSTGEHAGHRFRVTRAGWAGTGRYLDLHLEPDGPDKWVDVHGPWPAALAEQVRFLFPGQPLATVMPAEAWVPQINAGSVVIAGVEWRPAVVRWQASSRTLEVVLEQSEDPAPDPVEATSALITEVAEALTPDPEPVEASRGVESLRMALQQGLVDHATAASTGPVFGTMVVGVRPQTLSVPEVRYLLSLLPPPPLPTEPGSRILITHGARRVPLDQPRLAFRTDDDRPQGLGGVDWVDQRGTWWHATDITGWQPAGGD